MQNFKKSAAFFATDALPLKIKAVQTLNWEKLLWKL